MPSRSNTDCIVQLSNGVRSFGVWLDPLFPASSHRHLSPIFSLSFDLLRPLLATFLMLCDIPKLDLGFSSSDLDRRGAYTDDARELAGDERGVIDMSMSATCGACDVAVAFLWGREMPDVIRT